MKLACKIVAVTLLLATVAQPVRAAQDQYPMTEMTFALFWNTMLFYFALSEYSTVKKLERAHAYEDKVTILAADAMGTKKIYAFWFLINGVCGALKLWEEYKRFKKQAVEQKKPSASPTPS